VGGLEKKEVVRICILTNHVWYPLVMMYSEILDFHNVDNVDTAQFLGTPITGDLSALSC
jgi:hypothetical protein